MYPRGVAPPRYGEERGGGGVKKAISGRLSDYQVSPNIKGPNPFLSAGSPGPQIGPQSTYFAVRGQSCFSRLPKY